LSESLAGRSLDDRYQIVRRIGEGAMGSVYLGRQVSVDRMVAIKVLNRGAPSFSTSVRRFMEEARAASGLVHPNVVTVHDFGRTSDGLLYLVMEFLDGVTLAQMLETGPMSVDRVVDIGAQVCSGLAAAHARGIVHRDLKPDNVMMCEVDGFGAMAKLLDFGIAKSMVPGNRNTMDGVTVGTPLYMSPEQASGRPVGFPSDIYALGVMLYEMLAGRPPFDDEDSLAVLHAHCHAEPPDIAATAPWPIPAPLAQIVMQCLRKRPEDRPASATTIRAVLAGLGPSRTPAQPDPAPAAAPVPATAVVGPMTPSGQPRLWLPGNVVGGRFRIERVERTEPCLVARAIDTHAPDETRVTLRRVPLPPTCNRDFLDLVVEQHLSLVTRFRHDGIVALRLVDVEHDHVRIVSAEPPGPTLEETLARTGRLAPDEAVELVLDLLPAIEALHGLGLVHQDIRPGTIRRAPDGRVVLDGVGLWPLAEAGLPLFPEEVAAEARLYKAPEQMGIIGDAIGPESDLYAIGALLYRLLTDQTPFEAHREIDVLHRKLTASVLQPSSLVAEVPAALDEIVARLLRPRAVDRFRSTDALAQALERFRNGEQVRAGEVFRQLGAEGRMHGRDTERRRLLERLDPLFEQRTGTVALVVGPPGIGKTRLVDEVALEVRRRQGLVVRAKAREADISSPFGAWREVLAGIGGAVTRMEGRAREGFLRRLALAVGSQGALLRPFAPWLARQFAGAPEPPPLDPDGQRDRLLLALCQVPLALATPETPLCLVLDDLQWTDTATLLILEQLAATVDRHPLLVLGCSRPPAGDGEGPQLLDRLPGQALTRIDLGGLSFSTVRAFLQERLGDIPGIAELAQTLLRLSDGNPAGLRTLLQEAEFLGALRFNGQSWRVDAPRLAELLPAQNVVSRIRGQVTGLGPEAVEILQAAAVWGSGFDVGVLSTLLPHVPRFRIVGTLVEAERAGLLRPLGRDDPGRRDFSHDSLRESLRFEMAPDARRALHRKAAEIVEDLDLSAQERLQRRADHLVHADARAEDIPVLEHAAKAALDGYAAQGALNLGNAALARLAGRPANDETLMRVRLLVASALAMARMPEEAARLHHEVLGGNPPPMVLARAYLDLGQSQFTMGRLEACFESYRRAAKTLGYRPPRLASGRALLQAWRSLREIWWESRRPRTYDGGRPVDPVPSMLADVLNFEARARFFSEGKAAALLILESLRNARRSGDLKAHGRILSQAGGQLASALGRTTLSRRMLDASVRAAEASGDLSVIALTRATRLMIYGAMGEFDRLDRERPEVESLVARVGDAWCTALFLSYLFDVAQERGRAGEGLGVVTGFAESLVSSKTREYGVSWAHNRGAWVALAVGRPDLARAIIDRTVEMELFRKDRPLQGYVRAWDVQTALDEGDPDRAIRAAETYARSLASGSLAKRHQAISTYVAAKACAGAVLETGAGPEGLGVLRRILQTGRGLARPFPIYRAQIALVDARLMLLEGRREAARRHVEHLLAQAARLPAGTLVAAETMILAASLAGGGDSPRGRALLRRAFEELKEADDCLPLKRGLARELNEPAGGEAEAERIAASLAATLRIPIARPQAASIPIAPRTGAAESGLELFEWTHASLSSVVRGEAPLDTVLHPIVRFAAVDVGILFRYDWTTGTLVPLASSPRQGPTSDAYGDRTQRICRQAVETMAPVIENNRVSTDGRLRGSRAAFPIARAGRPELVLFLSNRSTPGLIDDTKVRHIETLLHVLDVAVAVAASEHEGPAA
jgi:serine/threonine-protein kinase